MLGFLFALKYVMTDSPFRRIPFQKTATSSAQYSDNKSSGEFSLLAAFSSHGGEAGNWHATEKIHGAQLQLYCGWVPADVPEGFNFEVRAATRTRFLDVLSDSFFGYQEVIYENKQGLLQLHEQIASKVVATMGLLPALEQGRYSPEQLSNVHIVCYGELFGGWYPSEPNKWKGAVESKRVDGKGKVVLSEKGATEQRPVQEGVYYSPSREYAVFDIAVVDARSDRTGSGVEGQEFVGFLPFNQTISLCDAAGVYHVPVLASGTLEKVQMLQEADAETWHSTVTRRQQLCGRHRSSAR